MSESTKHIATINGVDYELIEDDLGTLRFPKNKMIDKLVDLRGDSGYSLNEMWKDYHHGLCTIGDMMELYRLIGYSLYGFWEIYGWEINTEHKMDEPVKIYLDGEPYPDEQFGNG